MERVSKYCHALTKEYSKDGVNSVKAAAYRKKLLQMLLACENESNDGCPMAVELVWRWAYYNQVSALRSKKVADSSWVSSVLTLFCGEIHSQLAKTSFHTALYNMYLGDLYRYLTDHDDECAKLSILYYRKSIEANPELGQAFNQLGLKSDGANAIRFFILAASARIPFKGSLDNLEKKLEDPCYDDISSAANDILTAGLISCSKYDLAVSIGKWQTELRTLKDPLKVNDLPLITNILCYTCDMVTNQIGDDSFLCLASGLCDTFSYLLDMINTLEEDDDEEEVLVMNRRKVRKPSSSDDSESDDADTEESTKTEPHHRTETPRTDTFIWPLSVCCEWLTVALPILHEIKARKTPVAAAFKNALDGVVDKVISKLNVVVKLLTINIEDASQETSWLLHGPSSGEGEVGAKSCIAEVSYWAQQLVHSDITAIEFVNYFRRKKTASDGSSLQSKMGKLAVDKKVMREVAADWLPVYVVLDYSAFDHLHIIRPMVASRLVIAVVSSSVLAKLDKMKSSGPQIRSAMRLVHQWQTANLLRVEECSSSVDCCERLARSSDAGNGDRRPAVALLTTDTESFSSMNLPSVSLYNITSFWSRWRESHAV